MESIKINKEAERAKIRQMICINLDSQIALAKRHELDGPEYEKLKKELDRLFHEHESI